MLGCLLIEIAAFLQKRWAFGHGPSPIHEDPWFSQAGLGVRMEAPDPLRLGINQPTVNHRLTTNTGVLATDGWSWQGWSGCFRASDVAFPRKEAERLRHRAVCSMRMVIVDRQGHKAASERAQWR